MTDFHVKHDADTVEIDIDATGEDQAALLDVFKECQCGRCPCPTNQSDKLESMDVAADEHGISMLLTPKPGEQIEVSQVEKCLDYTIDMLEDQETQNDRGADS